MRKFLICFIVFLSQANAREIIHLVRSSRALLMGDAFTSLSNDDYTLFYNPGALGENDGIHIYPINLSAASTNLLKSEDRDRLQEIDKNDVNDIVKSLLDFPVFIGGGINPGLKLGNFGFNVILNGSARVNVRNATHPTAEIITRYDRGFVAGYALNFNSGAGVTSIGLSAKYLWRDGQQGFYDLFEVSTYDDISDPDCDEKCIKETLDYAKGTGIGWDIGLLHVARLDENSQFRLGLSFLDIGDTTFSTDGVPTQEMLINVGVSYIFRDGAFNWTLSADLHPINSKVVFGRQVHVGGEIGFDIVQVLAGFNGGYFSFGAEFDLKIVKATAGIYDVEVGGGYRDERAKRMLFYIGLLETKF
ncbi:MAG: hypothetical protein DRQ88_09065 [Epsilonproteobacteria bacterium]|nr:MAG: hypothetical protein DRQ89_09855 [Campylobacterota bacterium]RLA65527.1 MAG: hypothetical protein DRQ88_09065 [Campylobacterota bacterium]